MKHLIAALLSLAALAIASPLAGAATSPRSGPQVGDEFEIISKYETSERTSDGSSGDSRGGSALLELVVAVRDGGLELAFDLPKSATAEDRARSWQFPARVFRAADGSTRLLNRPELEARLDGWLKAAGWTRDACGQWIFTWNAFFIDCDPASVLDVIAAVDLRSAGLREGSAFEDAAAKGSGTLTRTAAGPDGATYNVVMPIDPDALRRARAESDVAVGQMMQKPVTLDAALRERAKDEVSGTLSVTFDTDTVGTIRRRTKVTKVETRRPDGATETKTLTETVERRPASGTTAARPTR